MKTQGSKTLSNLDNELDRPVYVWGTFNTSKKAVLFMVY